MLPSRPLLFFWDSGSHFFSTTSRQVLRLICLPVQSVPGFFPQGLNLSRCDIGHSPLSRAEVKNERIYTFAPPCVSSWFGKGQLDLCNPFSGTFLTAYWKTKYRTVSLYVLVLHHCEGSLHPLHRILPSVKLAVHIFSSVINPYPANAENMVSS
jgi:hypothetical protein